MEIFSNSLERLSPVYILKYPARRFLAQVFTIIFIYTLKFGRTDGLADSYADVKIPPVFLLYGRRSCVHCRSLHSHPEFGQMFIDILGRKTRISRLLTK